MRSILPVFLLSLAAFAVAAPVTVQRDGPAGLSAIRKRTEWVDPDGTVHSTEKGETVPPGVWYFDYDETIVWLPGTPVDPEGRVGPLPDQYRPADPNFNPQKRADAPPAVWIDDEGVTRSTANGDVLPPNVWYIDEFMRLRYLPGTESA